MSLQQKQNVSHCKISQFIAIVYLQELHLHGNSIGDEGVTALMSGLALHKGLHFALSISNFGQ